MIEAIEFVKKFGWEASVELVENHNKCYLPDVFDMWSDELQDFVLATKYASFDMSDLKTLVNAWELVEKFGGLFHAKVTLEKEGFTGGIEVDNELIEDVVLKQAIELVESCND